MIANMQSETSGAGRGGGVLLIRFGATEAILALPVLRALREVEPDGEVGWLVDRDTAPLLRGHPEIARLHVLPGTGRQKLGWWSRRGAMKKLRDELRECGYRATLDLESSAASSRAARSSGAKLRVGFAEAFRPRHTHAIVPGPGAVHEIDRNLSLLRPFGVTTLPSAARYVYPDFSGDRARLPFAGEAYVLVHLGPDYQGTRWPLESFAKLTPLLCDLTGAKVVIAASAPEDFALAEAVAREANGRAEAWHAADVRELAAGATGAALLVGLEHPAFHMAWTSGVPSVGIYGPTRREARGPRAARSLAVAADLGCIGCGRARCPDGTAACMSALSVEAVAEAAREVYRR